jgi:hypothetical protein
MDIKCLSCQASLLKSYGSTYKLRSRSIRWDSLNDTAKVQCNMCRSFNDVPLELKIEPDKLVIQITNQIKKSSKKEKLVVPTTIIKNTQK